MNCERDEEMLTRGLQSLAAEMESLEAPPAVEAKLLEAFRARQVVVPIASRRSSSWQGSRYWLAAIAAMLLIAISVVVFRWGSQPAENPREAVRREEPRPQPTINDK